VVEFGINKSDGVTAVSQSLKDQTNEYFDINNDIKVIYNFVDFNRFKKSDKDHFKKAIAPEGEKILMHTSNFRKVKRVDDVMHVFQKVHKQIPSKLLLIGDGPERQGLEELCRKMGLCEDVRFLGKQDAIEELLAVGDLFLMPSESESFGLAALEAMACEMPVISSNAGGLPEVNEHGKTGFLSPVGAVDDMAHHAITLLENTSMLATFRANALNKAKSFSLDNILPQYEAYYEHILDTALYSQEI
jgi:N-acetyl-alpha-D-glucosaminyl L-malate synthase BshA